MYKIQLAIISPLNIRFMVTFKNTLLKDIYDNQAFENKTDESLIAIDRILWNIFCSYIFYMHCVLMLISVYEANIQKHSLCDKPQNTP